MPRKKLSITIISFYNVNIKNYLIHAGTSNNHALELLQHFCCCELNKQKALAMLYLKKNTPHDLITQCQTTVHSNLYLLYKERLS